MEPILPLVDLAGTLDGGEGAPAAVAETHISVVFFAGSRAYKWCKPLDLGFIDLSTRERRQLALTRELEQNRRFAPDVYLGLLDLVPPGAVEAVDHLLVMRRMPADRRLARLLAGPDASAHLRAVARQVAVIHAAAPRLPAADAAAGLDAVRGNWDDNEAALRPFVGRILDGETVDAVGGAYRRYLAGRAPLFGQRIAGGHAVDGHGDLLADDIFCLADGVRILDCLAFDDRLRYGDVLADIAFLVMDVERLAGPAAAADLLRWYGEFSAEHHPDSLAHHYVAYRAQVRAKVACLRADQGHGTAAAAAADHLARCVAHLARSRIRMVAIGGAPGTGKSTLAAALADATGWSVLRADEIRKELAGLPADADATARFGQGIYGGEATEATYGELLRRASRLAEMGESVILDASWTSDRWRTDARAAAEAVSADLVELRADAPEAVAAQRIEARRARADDPSDATAEVARELRRRADPWPGSIRIDTAGTIGDSVGAAVRATS